jgi:hypothetical protein
VNVPGDPFWFSGYGRSVRNSAVTDKTASPASHATRKGASIGLEPIAARTNITKSITLAHDRDFTYVA